MIKTVILVFVLLIHCQLDNTKSNQDVQKSKTISPTGDECIEGDCKEGYGKMIYADGSSYEGNFKNSKKDGLGKYKYNFSGSIYEGDWKEDKQEGLGTIIYEDGSVYKGRLKDGAYDGYGIMKYSDGMEFRGQFKDHEVTKGHMYKNGIIFCKNAETKKDFTIGCK